MMNMMNMKFSLILLLHLLMWDSGFTRDADLEAPHTLLPEPFFLL